MPPPRATKDKVRKKRTAGDVRRRGDVANFRALVWKYWKENGRHDLPWRKTKDPYRILVSEMMLQQTQVPRVLGKYDSFLKRFPAARALAKAPLSDVLKEWSGLGYNRRAKYLHDAAKILAKSRIHNNNAIAFLLCKGIGPYTRDAVSVFAFNEPKVLIETNIRTVYIHHFFPHTLSVRDRALLVYAEKAAKGQDPREWHWALMDYGAHLKQSGVRNNNRSSHYAKQSKFEGSLRQVRGAILRELHRGLTSVHGLPFSSEKIEEALAALARDGLIVKKKGKWRIA